MLNQQNHQLGLFFKFQFIQAGIQAVQDGYPRSILAPARIAFDKVQQCARRRIAHNRLGVIQTALAEIDEIRLIQIGLIQQFDDSLAEERSALL